MSGGESVGGYVFLAILGVWLLGDWMWLAVVFELLHGNVLKAIGLSILIWLFSEDNGE